VPFAHPTAKRASSVETATAPRSNPRSKVQGRRVEAYLVSEHPSCSAHRYGNESSAVKLLPPCPLPRGLRESSYPAKASCACPEPMLETKEHGDQYTDDHQEKVNVFENPAAHTPSTLSSNAIHQTRNFKRSSYHKRNVNPLTFRARAHGSRITQIGRCCHDCQNSTLFDKLCFRPSAEGRF